MNYPTPPLAFPRRALLALVLGLGVATCPAENAFSGRHVLVIGIDGCRADSVLPADAPHLHKLIANGVVSYRAFAGGVRGTPSAQPTSSGPGWSSILTGVWRDKHGVRNNDFTGENYAQYPHFFQRIKELEPDSYLSSIVSWNPIDTAIVSPVDAHTDFRAKGVGGSVVQRDRWVRDAAVAHLQEADPDVLFLHLDQVDGAGHGTGYNAQFPAYLNAIAAVDALIGDVLAAIETRPNRAEEEWLVVVTTDHGGLNTSHGGQSEDERNIFVIVSGDGTASVLSQRELGHTAVPSTVLEYLGLAVDAAWGWEEPAFGLPPYPPAQLEVLPGLGRELVVRWRPPVDLPADQLVLKRNGKTIANLSLDAVQHVDTIPAGFFALQVVYTLEVAGASEAIEPLRAEVNVPVPLSADLVLHWPLDGDAQDVSGGNLHGLLSDSAISVGGAYGGEGLELGVAVGGAARAGSIQTALSAALKFDRFTDYSIGLWIRVNPGAEGVLLATKTIGKSSSAGWILSLAADGALQWSMGDGVRHVLVSANGLSVGEWHHVGVAVDRLRTTTLFIDGTARDSQDIAQLKASDGPGPLTLASDPAFNAAITVQVDDLRIWRRTLEAREWQGLVETRAAPARWREREFTFEERFDPLTGSWEADPDGDGRCNLEEFALGSDPRAANFEPVLTVKERDLIWAQSTGGTGNGVIDYRHRGVLLCLQESSSLQAGTWRTVSNDQGELLAVDYQSGGTHTARWQPAPTPSPRFYRLHFTLDRENN